MFEDDEEVVGFWRKRGGAVGAIALVALIGAAAAWRSLHHERKVAETIPVTKILVLPQPTPLPMKPVATPTPAMTSVPKETRFIKNGPSSAVRPPQGLSPKLAGKPPAPGQTTIIGAGPGSLTSGNGPEIGGMDGGPGSGAAGRFGSFGSQVTAAITQALRNNPRTRRAEMKLTVRVWPDAQGRIVKARISPGTGNTSLDRLIQTEVLTGLQLASAPPAEMPVPIVMQVSAARP